MLDATSGQTDCADAVTARPPLRPLVVHLLGRIRFGYLVIPVLLALALGKLSMLGVLSRERVFLDKLEAAALVLLSIAFAACLLQLRRGVTPFFRWLTFLVGLLLLREIHFTGTSSLTYIGLAVLAHHAWSRWPDFAPDLGSVPVMTFLAVVFFTYLLTQGLDWHWFAFIPGEHTFERPTEESLELFGHLTLLGLVLYSRGRVPDRPG